jgi:small subunit ribosomal protein S16
MPGFSGFKKKLLLCTLIFKKFILINQIMPTKIRLQRHGRKGRPFYHIVIADGRAPRDGRFIEKIGTYNPLTKPADIDLDFDRALHWLQTGAQPTDTVRAIFSYKGILYKFHLLKGVKKGALTQEQAEEKFSAWLEEKETKIRTKVKEQELLQKEQLKKIKEEESKLNEARAAELAKKQAKEAAKEAAKHAPAVEAEAEAVAEEVTEEVQETTPEAEVAVETVEETPAVEETEKAEEPKDAEADAAPAEKAEEKAEVKAEEPAAELKEESSETAEKQEEAEEPSTEKPE